MSKRILAVGNGNELLEATPQGDVIRWVYDARTKRYMPITEDAASAYGAKLQKRQARITLSQTAVYEGLPTLGENELVGMR